MYLLSKKSLWLSDGSMGFGQESDVAFAEGIRFTNETSALFAMASALLCFIGIMLERGNYHVWYAFENITGSLPLWQGWHRATEIGCMLLDGFSSGEINLYFTYLNDFGNKSRFFS